MAKPISPDDRFTAERYFQLVAEGVIDEDDRVELLDGVIVAMSPSGPRHATTVHRAADALRAAVGHQAAVRPQTSFVAGAAAVPEPDIAVVPGTIDDYRDAHPTTALLVVEVADSSLPQDRITKARIYAAAGVPEYWIVNLRDDRIEVLRDPDTLSRCYQESMIARRGDVLAIAALADATVAVDDMLPLL